MICHRNGGQDHAFGPLGKHSRKFVIDKDCFRVEDSVSTTAKTVSLIHLVPDVESIYFKL